MTAFCAGDEQADGGTSARSHTALGMGSGSPDGQRVSHLGVVLQKTAGKPEWLTLREAAQRAGRSYTWAWDRAFVGLLEPHPGLTRPLRVSAASVTREIERDRLGRAGQRRKKRRPALRLVVDNTK